MIAHAQLVDVADLVWLDRDPRSTPELDAVRVVGTYLRGDRVYAAQ